MKTRKCCAAGLVLHGPHRNGQPWTCTTCWQTWVHVCDEVKACAWNPMDAVPAVRLDQWAVKCLRDALRAAARRVDPVSRASPTSWQSAVRRGWLRIDAGAAPGQRYVVLDAGHQALAGHALALQAITLSQSQLRTLRNAAAGQPLDLHVHGAWQHGGHVQVVASLQRLGLLDAAKQITLAGRKALPSG